jgi:ferritin-like metal-binding protein YciE
MHHDEKLRGKLITYIEDAYGMENQIVETLEKQVKETQKFPDIQARIQQHLDATREHRTRMEERLAFYNKKPSTVKGVITNMMGNMIGAVGSAREDTLAKNARDDYVTEHLEIAAYELLIATAQAFGDQDTIRACEANLRDEVMMANWLEQGMARTALLSLRQDGINIPDTALLSAESAVSNALQSAHSQLPGGMTGQTTTTTPTPTM